MASSPRDLLRGAALCAFAFVVMLALAYGSSRARHIDASALQGFFGLQRPRVSEVTGAFGRLGNPLQVAVIALTLAAVAALRGRPRLSLFVLAYVGATSVSSQALKALLAYPRDSDIAGSVVNPAPAAFPSGHSTAAMTLAIALVVVVPARLRPLAALVGAVFALGVSFSVVSMGWHFPSDAVGGYLLAAGWAFLLLAAVRWADLRFPARTGRGVLSRTSATAVGLVAGAGLVLALIGGLVAAAAVAAVVVAFHADGALAYAADRPAFTVVAALLALSVAVLLAGLTRSLARRG